MNWVELPKGSWSFVKDKKSHCQLEVSVRCVTNTASVGDILLS